MKNKLCIVIDSNGQISVSLDKNKEDEIDLKINLGSEGESFYEVPLSEVSQSGLNFLKALDNTFNAEPLFLLIEEITREAVSLGRRGL